jgi:hypothetical protein
MHINLQYRKQKIEKNFRTKARKSERKREREREKRQKYRTCPFLIRNPPIRDEKCEGEEVVVCAFF